MKPDTNVCIKIIGIGESKASLLPDMVEMIYKSPILMGGERQLGYFPDFMGKKLVIKNNPADLAESLKNENQNAVVLASGDPLFFGIGGYLLSQFAATGFKIEIYPSISSMQMAFAKAGISWQDSKSMSLHGRNIRGLAQRVYAENKIAILTDQENHPGKIAAYMLHFNLNGFRAFVAENLGMEGEKTQWYSLDELAQKESEFFSPLNVLILIADTKYENRFGSFAIPDEEFSFPEKPDGLITKKEIRALSLGAMNLNLKSVVWDIGSCTGSVAIEAARIAREGHVYAIEKNPSHIGHLRLNVKKFHTDIDVVEIEAPMALEGLMDPDAVFIGGSGGRLCEILDICMQKLRPGGRIVINAATVETLNTTVVRLKQQGFDVETCMAQISRSRPIGDLTRFQALNPVFILTGCRTKNG